MPHSRSKKKDVRQIETRTAQNRKRSSAMKTAIRRVGEAVEEGDSEQVKQALAVAYKRIDKAAKANVIHDNTAARRKARVARRAADVLGV